MESLKRVFYIYLKKDKNLFSQYYPIIKVYLYCHRAIPWHIPLQVIAKRRIMLKTYPSNITRYYRWPTAKTAKLTNVFSINHIRALCHIYVWWIYSHTHKHTFRHIFKRWSMLIDAIHLSLRVYMCKCDASVQVRHPYMLWGHNAIVNYIYLAAQIDRSIDGWRRWR